MADRPATLRRAGLSLAVLALAVAGGCGPSSAPAAPGGGTAPGASGGRRARIDQVQLRVIDLFSEAVLTVSADGRLVYEPVSTDGAGPPYTTHRQVPAPRFIELVELIERSGFQNLAPPPIVADPSGGDLTNATTYAISVRSVPRGGNPAVDGTVQSVTCRGECPDAARAVIERLKGLWGRPIPDRPAAPETLRIARIAVQWRGGLGASDVYSSIDATGLLTQGGSKKEHQQMRRVPPQKFRELADLVERSGFRPDAPSRPPAVADPSTRSRSIIVTWLPPGGDPRNAVERRCARDCPEALVPIEVRLRELWRGAGEPAR